MSYTPQSGDTVRWPGQQFTTHYKVEIRGWQDDEGQWHDDDEWEKVPDLPPKLPPILERWTLVSASGAQLFDAHLSLAGAQQDAGWFGATGVLHVMPDGTCEMLPVDDG